jgi:hypothetical protein
MIRFGATILQFDKQGEKTGWSYLHIPADLAQELKPGNSKSFRVKGKLDGHAFRGTCLLPMGGGDFILPFNAAMRKGTGKRAGAMVEVSMQLDSPDLKMPKDFADWLEEDEAAKTYFYKLPKSHRHYWIKWLDGVKSPEGRKGRLDRAIVALSQGFGFAEMLRAEKAARL